MPRAVGQVKQCAKCLRHFGLGQFHKQTKRPDGLNPYCKECANAATRNHYQRNSAATIERTGVWKRENKDKANASAQKWRDANRETLRARKKAEYAADPEAVTQTLRNSAFKRKYGITLEERDAMAEAQGYRCAICGRHETEFTQRLAVDHDHESEAVRELLCNPCNNGLARFGDDPERMLAAIAYVRKHRGQAEEGS